MGIVPVLLPVLLLLGLPIAAPAAPPAGNTLVSTLPAGIFTAEGATVTVDSLFTPGHFSRHCDADACRFLTDPRVPHGATIEGFELDGCNDSTRWPLWVRLLQINNREQLFGGTDPYLVLGELTVPTGAGCGYFFAELTTPATLDLYNYTYLVVVQPQVLLCGLPGTPCPGSATRFNALRVYYSASPSGVVEPSLKVPLPTSP